MHFLWAMWQQHRTYTYRTTPQLHERDEGWVYLQRTSWALNLFLGSRVSILQTRSLALSEILGQGSDSKSSLPRRICLKIPASVSEEKTYSRICRVKRVWMTNTNSKKMANIYLPKMGGHHKAKCTESPLRSIHQLLDHSISVVPQVQHSRGSQQHHWIYHLRKWKRQLASSINLAQGIQRTS